MYRLVLKCLRHDKLDYLYLMPIVDQEDVMISFGLTFNKYKSYSFSTIHEAKFVLKYLLNNKKELMALIKEYTESIVGYEIEEDYGTQKITRLVEIGKVKL